MGKLAGLTTYLIGNIDGAHDGGYGWRKDIKPFLRYLGVKILDPLDKNIDGYEEDEETRMTLKHAQSEGHFDYVMSRRTTRNIDLRMVDVSDFVVCNVNFEERPVGSIEEISVANRSKIPFLLG